MPESYRQAGIRLSPADVFRAAEALLGKPTRRGDREWRWGRKGSLAVAADGSWYDHEKGEGGGLLDLVVRVRGGSYADAAAWLGLPKGERPTRPRRESRRKASAPIPEAATAAQSETVLEPPSEPSETPPEAPEDRSAEARRIWEAARPIGAVDRARLYLRSRGIEAAAGSAALRCGGDGLVAALTGEDGEVVAVQVIHVGPTGVPKRRPDGSKIKLLRGRCGGAAVRLFPPRDGLIAIAEGVETAIAAAILLDLPVWASCGAGRMADIGLPSDLREVVIIADADSAGRRGAARALAAWHGRVRVTVLTLKQDGADAADLLAEGATPTPWRPGDPPPEGWQDITADLAAEADIGLPPPFRREGEWIVADVEDLRARPGTPPRVVRVIGGGWRVLRTEVPQGGEEGVRLRVRLRTRDGRWIEESWPVAWSVDDAREAVARAAWHGVPVGESREARRLLVRLLQDWGGASVVRAYTRPGWHGDRYVTPATLAPGEVLDGAEGGAWSVRGDLATWHARVVRPLGRSSRGIMALCAAFAAPVVSRLGEEGGLIHLYGASSTGKTTLARAALSVWGSPRARLGSWRATAAGLEAACVAANDGLVALDEIGSARPDVVAEAAYAIANGVGKARARRDGTSRPPARWTVLGLSTGEVAMRDVAARARDTHDGAGRDVRVIDLPLPRRDAAWEYPEDVDPRALGRATEEIHGVAGAAWARLLSAEGEAICAEARAEADRLYDAFATRDAGGQALRVLDRLSLIAAAGVVAARRGVLGLDPAAIEWALGVCYRAWIAARGGAGDGETTRVLAWVRDLIARQAARFEGAEEAAGVSPRDRLGWARSIGEVTHYCLAVDTLDRLAREAGLSGRTVRETLAARGLLHGSAGRETTVIRVHGVPVRVVAITERVMAAEDAEGEDAPPPPPPSPPSPPVTEDDESLGVHRVYAPAWAARAAIRHELGIEPAHHIVDRYRCTLPVPAPPLGMAAAEWAEILTRWAVGHDTPDPHMEDWVYRCDVKTWGWIKDWFLFRGGIVEDVEATAAAVAAASSSA